MILVPATRCSRLRALFTGSPIRSLHSPVSLIVLSPDIGAQYFLDVASVVNAGGRPTAALVSVMARYGLRAGSAAGKEPAVGGTTARTGRPA